MIFCSQMLICGVVDPASLIETGDILQKAKEGGEGRAKCTIEAQGGGGKRTRW